MDIILHFKPCVVHKEPSAIRSKHVTNLLEIKCYILLPLLKQLRAYGKATILFIITAKTSDEDLKRLRSVCLRSEV